VKLAADHVKNKDSATLLVVGDQDGYERAVTDGFAKLGVRFRRVSMEDIGNLTADEINQVECIVGCFLNSKHLTMLGLKLVNHPVLSNKVFEYVLIPRDEYQILEQYDWQVNTSFVSPLLVSDIDYFDLYKRSLSKFELKCQIRDYMDLCQLVSSVVKQDIEGDIAEFGSYKGHSGWLMSNILKQFDSKKKLYMFDMFEEFPEEVVGVDSFWSKTHHVDYSEVKSNFSDLDNVSLVKGDFTKTYEISGIDKLCFIYIDCDSYRGTKYLLETLYDDVLAKNGIVGIEDYGHGPLLGNRLAYHEFFDGRDDCFKFFSQFSGFQIVVKK